MPNIGDLINFSSLGTAKLGDTINRNNPGANGSAFIMVAPSFACWSRTDSTPTFGTEPKMWTNFQYWNGSSWVGVYAGNQGASKSIQYNVNYSFDTGDSTYVYHGPTTPILFQSKRIQGNGDRTHCRWIFMQPGHAGKVWYDRYLKGNKIYRMSKNTGIYVASDGRGAASSAQLAMSNIQANLPLTDSTWKILADESTGGLTCLPLGYTR